MQWDRDRWPNFPLAEMQCSHTGECEMQPHFMDALQALRNEVGPLTVTSGYRALSHPEEVLKDHPGEHTLGLAADVACWSDEAMRIARVALRLGFTRVGVSQSSRRDARFLHLGMATPEQGFPEALYSY